MSVTKLTSDQASSTTSGLSTMAPARVVVVRIVERGTSPFHVELESREPETRNRAGFRFEFSSPEFHVERSARRTRAALTAASNPESQVTMPA